MAAGIETILDAFELEKKDIRSYSPLTLAYIGDAVFELIIRSILVGEGNEPVKKLHKRATQMVRAGAQSEMIRKVEGLLSEEEASVYKRGRNAHPSTIARSASMSDYRRATGFEALMGYLFMTGQMERALSLVRKGLLQDDPGVREEDGE